MMATKGEGKMIDLEENKLLIVSKLMKSYISLEKELELSAFNAGIPLCFVKEFQLKILEFFSQHTILDCVINVYM
jgi:hypothetical protein